MGFNTSAIILNDALECIAGDKDAGKKIRDAVLELSIRKYVDIPMRNHANAMAVIETHHADRLVPVLIGANYGVPLEGVSLHWTVKPEEMEKALLKNLAEKHGYSLHRKPSRR